MPASDWAELCQQVICWQPKTGRTATGMPTYGAVQTFSPANLQGGRRVHKTLRMSLLREGGAAVDFVQGSIIWILATPAIGLEDRVYVQGDAEPFPPILGVDQYPDETGVYLFTKVTLGNANG